MTRLQLEDLHNYLDSLDAAGFTGDVPLWAVRKLAELMSQLDLDVTNTVVNTNTEIAERLAELDSRIAALESAERSRQPTTLWPGG